MQVEPLTGKALAAYRMPAATITAYEGSVRSGKTFTSLLAWLHFIRTGPPGMLLMTGRTERTIIANLLVPLQEWLGAERLSINRGLGTANILGREVMLVGANNEAAVTKIQGRTLVGAYVDEAGTLPESYFNMLHTRFSVVGARMWLSSNPEGPEHWLKRKWLDRASLWIDQDGRTLARDPDDYTEGSLEQPLDLHRVSWNLGDNPHLPAEYVERIKRSYSGLWYKRYVEGLWCVAEGAIWEQWDPARHVAPASTFPTMTKILCVGVDYGDTHLTRGYLLGLGPDTREGQSGQRLYTLDEWAPGAMTIGEHSASLRSWLAGQPEAWRNPDWVAVDPSAGSFRRQLSHDGVHNVRNAHNAVLPGIRTVAALLAMGKLVVADTCTHLVKRVPGYVWDAKATARGEDKPVKENDDECDAWRYSIQTSSLDWQDLIPLAPTLNGTET